MLQYGMNIAQNGLSTSNLLQAPAVKNPFINKVELTWVQILKAVVCFILIFPLRLIGSLAIFFIVTGLSHIILYNQSAEDADKPMTSWRKHLRNSFSYWTRVLLFLLGFHWIRVKGKVAPANEAPLLVTAPHCSWLDVLMLCVAGVPSGLSKSENFQAPFIGAFFRAIQCIPVSRDAKNSRQSAIEELKKRATQAVDFPQTVIFPEGTCTNRKSLITYKGGAFFPGCPIQPVCIKYCRDPDLVSWTWMGNGALSLFMLLICQFNNSVEIEFLPVHVPTEEEKKNPALFGQRVRVKMARCLDVPLTEHSYEDCLLMMEAKKLGLPMEVGLIEFQKFRAELGVNLDHLKDELLKFSEMDSDKDGYVSVEDYAKTLNIPVSSAVKELFTLYNPAGCDVVDFRQFVIGNHIITSIGNKQDVLNKAHQVLKLHWDDSAENEETKNGGDNVKQIIQECLLSRGWDKT